MLRKLITVKKNESNKEENVKWCPHEIGEFSTELQRITMVPKWNKHQRYIVTRATCKMWPNHRKRAICHVSWSHCCLDLSCAAHTSSLHHRIINQHDENFFSPPPPFFVYRNLRKHVSMHFCHYCYVRWHLMQNNCHCYRFLLRQYHTYSETMHEKCS